MKELFDDIFSVNENIRYIGIVNNRENTFQSRHRENITSLLSAQDEADFVIDQQKVKNIHDRFDDFIGRVTAQIVLREKVNILFFYVRDLIIYVSIEKRCASECLVQIFKDIKEIISERTIIPNVGQSL